MIIQYDKCLFCKKKLRTKQQKRYGYCNNAESLAHLHYKLDLITQKLIAEEQEFENMSFEINPNLEHDFKEQPDGSWQGSFIGLTKEYLHSDEYRLVAEGKWDWSGAGFDTDKNAKASDFIDGTNKEN